MNGEIYLVLRKESHILEPFEHWRLLSIETSLQDARDLIAGDMLDNRHKILEISDNIINELALIIANELVVEV